MSDHLHNNTNNKRLSLSLSLSSPSKKKPKPILHDAFSIDDQDEPELHQQLISNLLLASSPSSPSQTTSIPFKVRFVSYPYLPLSPVESSSSYVTINGNEETCGSSFSDSDSSLMASVDTCAGARAARGYGGFGFLSVPNGDVFGSDGTHNNNKKVSREEEDVDGWDWGEFLDHVLEEGKIN